MGWLTSFIFLYAVLWLIERKRVDLDAFIVLTVALVPAILHFLLLFLSMVVEMPGWVSTALWVATYPIVFALLWKLIPLAPVRAGVYAIALFVFDMALAVGVLTVTGQV